MNVALAVLLTLAAIALAVAAILLVRTRAPEGSFFADGDRASGFFGVLAAGFAILLGFVVFLAFESFDQSRRGAETEALVVMQQFETAQFLPPATGRRLSDELICYARSIVHQEWPRMEDGTQATASIPGVLPSSGRCSGPTRRRPSSSPRSTSGWSKPPTGRGRETTASTGPRASFRIRSGPC